MRSIWPDRRFTPKGRGVTLPGGVLPPPNREDLVHRHRIPPILLATVFALSTVVGTAAADTPVGAAHYVPCPGFTGEGYHYQSFDRAPYRCHSAVIDPLGNVVILRQGRSDAGPSAFGWLHTLFDHNVDDHVVERVVSSAFPLRAPRGRFRYIAELRVEGRGVMDVWVEVDRAPSITAPDDEPFGVVTAYCKIPYNADPENKCPEWVNDSLLP